MKQMFRHNVMEIDYHMEESFKQNQMAEDKYVLLIFNAYMY